jgi:prepilin-type N-terminal cleavage/methylation domain-containing protein
MRFTLRGRAGQAGFTLVELMVTLLILGILVGIVVMTMSVSRSKAQQAACKANLRTLYDAIQVFRSVHDATVHDAPYPATLDALVTDGLIKSSFSWKCPAGPYNGTVPDYRTYYDSSNGHTSCPRADHNP